MARITPSAVGDRQIFPRQTNNTLRIRDSCVPPFHFPLFGSVLNGACLATLRGEIRKGSETPTSGIQRRDHVHKSRETVVTTLRYKDCMRKYTPGLTLAGIAALLLTACGGGGGSSSSSSSSGGNTNTAPIANAGSNQTVTSGVTVTLNGTSSNDPDGTIASYAWTQTAGTPTVTLTSGTTSQPTFPAPTVATAATFTFSLVVTDNRGATSPAAVVNVTVNPNLNVAPTANAGTNQTVTSGVTVTLNGSTSNDPDGSIASYAWTQTAGTPAVTLANGASALPTF